MASTAPKAHRASVLCKSTRRRAWWADQELELSKTEFDLLELLVRNTVDIPVGDDGSIAGAVRATSPRTAAWQQILTAWLIMAALAGATLGAAWIVGRRQAGRLAAPGRLGAGKKSPLPGDASKTRATISVPHPSSHLKTPPDPSEHL